MEKKNILVFGVALLFLVVLVTFFFGNGDGDTSNQITQSASVLAAVEDSFDFGTISMQDGMVSHQFEIKNRSQKKELFDALDDYLLWKGFEEARQKWEKRYQEL